jgi:hypothetical protein
VAIHQQGAEQGSTRSYVPSSQRNRESPEPIVFRYRVPTEAGIREIDFQAAIVFLCKTCGGYHSDEVPKILVDGVQRDCPGPTSIEEKVEGRRRRLSFFSMVVREYVLDGSNYSVRGKAISTGADLAEYGHEDFITELAGEVRKSAHLTEAQKKTSDEQEKSSSARTAVSNGNAGPAVSTTGPREAAATGT